MSLINNALKKAQRQRAAEAAAFSPGGTPPLRRGQSGLPTQAWVLILAGAAVIIVLSVVLTVYLLRPAPPTRLTAATTAPAMISPTPAEPAPLVTMPAIGANAPTLAPPPPPVVVEPPAVAQAEATSTNPTQADERIYAFIDKLQIMGVRSSGTDSKVLMNDRVYRMNDIVDRALALRLKQVAPDHLVFEDANGITYTKTF